MASNWIVLGTDPNFVPRYQVVAPMVCAKAHDGRIRQCLAGSQLDWLGPEQEAHFLGMGLVERIDA
jgi:hypothetical protein